MADARNDRNIHPEAHDLAKLAIGAALLGEQAAVHRYNQQLVGWHAQRATHPAIKARAARTLEQLGRQLRDLEPRQPAPIPLRYQPEIKRDYAEAGRAHGELKREVLEALLAAAEPVTINELVEQLDVVKDSIRKALYRMLDAGVVAQLPAREHRPDTGFQTRYCWTTTDRAAELTRAA